MMTKISILSVPLLCVGLIGTSDAFGVQPKGSLSSLLSENSRRRSSLQYQNEESPTATATASKKVAAAKSKKKNNSIVLLNDENEWDLREDWALQDSVPRYTVSGATFWTQLKHSTPELAQRSEQELEQRYKEWYSSSEDSLLVECGPSPVLLSDWRVTTAAPLPSRSTSRQTRPTTTMMSGSLPNGSQIWFPLKCAGTLGDDPFCDISSEGIITQDTLDDCFISASMMMHTAGYAESTGGVVYELGAPRCEAHRIHSPRTGLDIATTSTESVPTPLGHTEAPTDVRSHLDRFQKNFASDIGKNVGTLSAIVAASAMSACFTLGYATNEMETPSVTQNRSGDIVASRARTTAPVYYGAAGASDFELSLSEKRARAELKVGRDKRSMVLMQDRLHKDEAKLEELRQEESRLTDGRSGL